MEAAATLFGLLTVAMLVRHAMNGGVVDGGAPTLAEQSIYTLIAIGGGAILVALDQRHSPSPVFRVGSIAVGVVFIYVVAVQHFFVLNPLVTNKSTGTIAVFNLLFLGYLLPGAAMAGLAAYARHKQTLWYVAMLALVASLLGFAYATLSLRRLFHGEFIGLWKDWPARDLFPLGAVAGARRGAAHGRPPLEVAGAAPRLGEFTWSSSPSAKVFLLDMAELEGVLRALLLHRAGGGADRHRPVLPAHADPARPGRACPRRGVLKGATGRGPAPFVAAWSLVCALSRGRQQLRANPS